MDKCFLLVFFLFCCIEGTALRCVTCYLFLKSDRCRNGFAVCVAEKQEKCMALKIYDYNLNHQLSYMVCQKHCKDLAFHLNNRLYVHKCCNYNYCNYRL